MSNSLFLALEPIVTWIKVEKPTFDLVGVVLNSFRLAGILLVLALAWECCWEPRCCVHDGAWWRHRSAERGCCGSMGGSCARDQPECYVVAIHNAVCYDGGVHSKVQVPARIIKRYGNRKLYYRGRRGRYVHACSSWHGSSPVVRMFMCSIRRAASISPT